MTERSEKPSISGMPSRHHAVEHIYPERDASYEIERRSHSHQVTGLVGRHQTRAFGNCRNHHRFRFAHRQTSDRVTWKLQVHQSIQTIVPQFWINPALTNPEKPLWVVMPFP